MTIDRRRCAVCSAQKDIDRTSSPGIVLSAMQAAIVGDSDDAASLYEFLTPLDAHIAVAVASNLLLELCRLQGFDPLSAIQAYRANLATYVAAQ